MPSPGELSSDATRGRVMTGADGRGEDQRAHTEIDSPASATAAKARRRV
jgi:hypothetical protein